MLHHQDFAPVSQTRWGGQTGGNRLDCETGVLLRHALEPVFQKAASWAGLRDKLRSKGFDLGFLNGRLILIQSDSGERICSCKFLGHPLAVLTARLGRVRAKAPKCPGEFGQLVA